MKKFKFENDYNEYKKGDVINMDLKIYHNFIHPLLRRGVLKVIEVDKQIREEAEEMIIEIQDEENQLLISSLLKKKMSELQDFGRKYGAKDTKKSELIEEIIKKAPLNDIKKFVGE